MFSSMFDEIIARFTSQLQLLDRRLDSIEEILRNLQENLVYKNKALQ